MHQGKINDLMNKRGHDYRFLSYYYRKILKLQETRWKSKILDN